MNREEAIQELKYAQAMWSFDPSTGEVRFRNNEDKRQYEAFGIAIEALKAQLLKENTTFGKWIPVSERLPEEGERVLATHLGGVNPNKQVIEHIYQCGKFTCGWDMDMNVDSPTFGQRYMGEVIAWMPLPEPYQEEGET